MGRNREATPHDVGARIKSGRLSRGLNQIELAEQAGVHRTVIARAEAGGVCRPSSLKKIAKALGVTLTWLNRPFLGKEPYRADHLCNTLWVATNPSFIRRKGLVTPEALMDPNERHRLGANKLANAFVRVLNNDLPGGRLHALIVESYRREQDPISFPGQMFLYVIKGRIRLWVDNEQIDLCEGDTVSYWADKPNLYEAIGTPDELPATVLEVFLDLSDQEVALRDQF
ncbi:MAG: helix-turn-helix domain-containing protein [Armatimonadetes bacterium]|nr:helix-turn-helix domain-containing protein [Armatimonadota bacterium]